MHYFYCKIVKIAKRYLGLRLQTVTTPRPPIHIS